MRSADDQFAITLFTDFGAASKTEALVSLNELAHRIRSTNSAQKSSLPWLKLARFGQIRTEKNSLRHDANVLAITGIEADYDGEQMSVAEAVERLDKAGILAMLYTSPSHTEDAPRWRVLCPTSTSLEPQRREKLMGRLNGLFRGIFSTESWTLSQAYYFGRVQRSPSHEVHIVDGLPIDEHDDLDEIWQGKPATIAGPPGLNGHSNVRWIDETALLAEITSGASYHMASVRLLGRWARTGVAYMDARRRLLAAFDAVPEAEKEGRWKVRYDDIDRCLEDIYGAEARKWDSRPDPIMEEPPAWIDEAPAWESVDGEAEEATMPREGENPPEAFPATPVSASELATIPPRELVYGHFLFRKFVSALGAPGGSGKTAYAYAVALALVCGRDFLSEGVYDPGNVWIYNLEDPRTELLRRLKAAMIGHDVSFADIEGRLFLDSGRDRPLVIAKVMRDGTVLAWPQVPELIKEIKARDIHLLIVDPFVRSHRVEENHNDQIDFVAALWAHIADQADCSILLVHHFKKGGLSGDASAFRGASALIDASRAAVTLSPMANDEADKLGIGEKDRWRYVRVDNAKLNLAPPPASALWLELQGVALNNATAERQGDNVQTVQRWSAPSAWDGISWADIEHVLNEIETGMEGAEFYALARQSKDRWAGTLIVARCGKTEGQAVHILKKWKETGLVEDGQYASPRRKGALTTCVRANKLKLTEIRNAGARSPDFQ